MRARDLNVKLGMDWGQASPGVVLWGAALPDGKVHIFDEFKFQRMTVPNVAKGVLEKCKEWNLTSTPMCFADPSINPAKNAVGEFIGPTLQRYGMRMAYPSNDRINGWQRVHEALGNAPDGTPWLTIDPRCRYLVRTIPLMVEAKNEPEDLDTETDDHACDALRYLLMGGLRPASKREKAKQFPQYSMGWWRNWHARQEQGTGVLA